MIDIAYSDVTDYMTFGQETVAVTGAFGPLEVVDPITKEKKILTKTSMWCVLRIHQSRWNAYPGSETRQRRRICKTH